MKCFARLNQMSMCFEGALEVDMVNYSLLSVYGVNCPLPILCNTGTRGVIAAFTIAVWVLI